LKTGHPVLNKTNETEEEQTPDIAMAALDLSPSDEFFKNIEKREN